MSTSNPTWLEHLEPPIAVVFGGGASLGALQVGMARALIEAGVDPDYIVGTSVGALNGSFLARRFDDSQIERLESIWGDITREDIFPGTGLFRTFRMLSGGELSLASHDGIRQLVDDYLPETYEELAIPMTVVASDLLSGEKVPLKEGDVRQHVVASASIPLVFEPVEIDGRTLIDGGVTSNVPVLPARKLGAHSMIVLDPGYPCSLDQVPSEIVGAALHLVTLMIRHQSHGVLHFLADDCRVVYIPPPCPLDVPPHDFSRSDELAESGYRQAKDFFSDLEIEGPGIYGHPHFHDEALSFGETT